MLGVVIRAAVSSTKHRGAALPILTQAERLPQAWPSWVTLYGRATRALGEMAEHTLHGGIPYEMQQVTGVGV